MQTRRRFLGAAALGLLGGAVPLRLRAQGLETARIIVGFPPGGTTDVMARKVADKLRDAYARAVIVENRPGAGGQIGVVALKDSPADGSTMLLTPSSMLTIYPNTYRTLQYKLDDVAPVSLAMYTHHALSVGQQHSLTALDVPATCFTLPAGYQRTPMAARRLSRRHKQSLQW